MRLAAFLIGIWLGGSLVILGVVGSSFPGVEKALDANPELAKRAGFDPRDEGARKTSVLWVYTGEQNRAYFWAWNVAQLVLAAVAFTVAWASKHGKLVPNLLVLALAVTCVLAFYLAPEITRRGRALDFVARVPAPPGLKEFNMLHQLYTALELGKTAVLLLAGGLSLRSTQAYKI